MTSRATAKRMVQVVTAAAEICENDFLAKMMLKKLFAVMIENPVAFPIIEQVVGEVWQWEDGEPLTVEEIFNTVGPGRGLRIDPAHCGGCRSAFELMYGEKL